MEDITRTTIDKHKIYVEYHDIGFFHGYYVWKGSDALFRIPNWLGRILTRKR